MEKILFISHDATRTGGPKSLLNILRWLSKNGKKFDVLLIKGGEIEEEFRKLDCGNLINLENIQQSGESNIAKDEIGNLWHRYDLIYANTVVSLSLAVQAKGYSSNSKVICHIHELEMGIIKYVGEDSFIQNIKHVDKFIAVSEAVKTFLIAKYDISPEKIEIIHGTIEMVNHDLNQSVVLKELGIIDKNDYFVVIGAGHTIWTKSPDLFVQIAGKLNKIYDGKFLFLWLGDGDTLEKKQLEYDLTRLNLTDKVKFLGFRNDIQDFYSISDVFLLTSREDSYPLVCLEAASFGTPVICFKDAGGMPEFVGDDAGYVVPYLAVDKAADHLKYLALNPEIRKKMGDKAKQKAAAHDINLAGKRISELLEKVLGVPTLLE